MYNEKQPGYVGSDLRTDYAVEVEKEREIPLELNYLSGAVSELETMVREVEDRFGPVITPMPKDGGVS